MVLESLHCALSLNVDNSSKIERQIVIDEIQDTKFLNFAVYNISELFGYLATGRVNIRICRDITGLPDGLFGGPARLPVRTAPARMTLSGWWGRASFRRARVWRACPTVCVAGEMWFGVG